MPNFEQSHVGADGTHNKASTPSFAHAPDLKKGCPQRDEQGWNARSTTFSPTLLSSLEGVCSNIQNVLSKTMGNRSRHNFLPG